MTADVEPFLCSAAEARQITDKIKGSVTAAWVLLSDAHDKRVWEPLGYSTWEIYVRDEFDLSRSRSYRLLDQARVIREIEPVLPMSPTGDIEASTNVDISERAARDIKPVLPEVVASIRERTADPRLTDQERRTVVVEEVAKARPTAKVTETTKTETYVDTGTGEVVAPPEPSDGVTAFLASSQSVQDANYLTNFMKAVVAAGKLTLFDPDRLAGLLDQTERDVLTRLARSTSEFAERATRNRGLRVVEGK